MQTYLKTKPVWMQLLLFLGMAFGLFVIATLIGISVLSKMTGISVFELQDSANWDLSNPAMMTFMRGMILLQFRLHISMKTGSWQYWNQCGRVPEDPTKIILVRFAKTGRAYVQHSK